MYAPNNLKYYVISDVEKKYVDINRKIIKFTKLYFYTIKNHSYQITQIENKLNEYSIKEEVKIKDLLESQQSIIEELIKIINKILYEKRNNEVIKKYDSQKFEKKNPYPIKQKNIISNLNIFVPTHYSIEKYSDIKNYSKEKNINIIDNTRNIGTNEAIKNKLIRSVENKMPKKILNQKKTIKLNIIKPKKGKDFNDTLSYLNMDTSKQKYKKKIYGKFLNKDKTNNPIKYKIIKSISTSEISSKEKNNNKNNLSLKINNINDSTNQYHMNNNYTIDEEKKMDSISLINERQNSISSSNMNENYGNLPHILTKRKKRIKYRIAGGKIIFTDKDTKIKNFVRVKSAKEIPIKTEFYPNYNSFFPNFTITNSSIEKNGDYSYHKRSNSSLCLSNFNLNHIIKENNKSLKKFESEILSIPYINNGKRIIPTRFTKEVLNSSYKILNKYEQKRFKKY